MTENIPYSILATYSFSDDDARNNFVDLLTSLGFENQPDESTMSLRFSKSLSRMAIIRNINNWASEQKYLYSSDRIELYYPTITKSGTPFIAAEKLSYNRWKHCFE